MTYSIAVTRAPSNGAALEDLSLEPATPLTYTGTVGTTVNYTASVSNTYNWPIVFANPADPNATVTVDGQPTTPEGGSSQEISLNFGQTTITIVVTAQDGVTTMTYVITVTRAPNPPDAYLQSIVVTPSAHITLTSTVGNTITYTTSVSSTVTSVTVTPTTNDPAATVTVNGVPVTSGTPSASITLGVPSTATTVTMVVTSSDGTLTMTYLLLVGHEPPSATYLSNLVISNGVLRPAFAPGTTIYNVSAGTGTVTITPTTLDPNATVTVNGVAVTSGTASQSITVPPSPETDIRTVVTAQDGIETNTYLITVIRPNIASLSTITLTPHTSLINAGTVGTTTTYNASVGSGTASVTVTPTTADASPR